MNPVIATGLINIGGNLLRQALPPSSDSSSTTKANFEKDLVEFQNRDAGKIENLDQLRSDLLKSPVVNEFLSQNTECSITLDQFSDGSIRILSSSGDFMTLPPILQIANWQASSYKDRLHLEKTYIHKLRIRSF